MINERAEDMSSGFSDRNEVINQLKVSENYIKSDVRNKVLNAWTESHVMPIIGSFNANKVNRNQNNTKMCVKKVTNNCILNDNSSDHMRHAIDVINSVAKSSDQQINANHEFNSSQTLNNSLNKVCESDPKLIPINQTNKALNNYEINTGFDSIANNSLFSLSSTKNDYYIKHFETKPKPKRKRCEKSDSNVKLVKKRNKSPNKNSNKILKVKMFGKIPFALSLKKDLLLSNANNGNKSHTELQNNSNGFHLPLSDTFTGIKTNNNLKLKKSRKITQTLNKDKAIKKKNTKIIVKSNSYMSSYQNFLKRQLSSDNKKTKNKHKFFPKRKSESQITAEKALLKSKSNAVKISRRRKPKNKPLVDKNFWPQKSYLDFIEKKFPPIKEGVPFIQDRSCKDFKKDFPDGISNCLDCNRDRKDYSQTCRFFQYRTLLKTGDCLSVYGFAEPDNATQEDSKLWLPGFTNACLDRFTAKFLLTFVGQQFCQIYTEEHNIIKDSLSLSITWKKPVKGIRELCDVCQTTIFNTHWVCPTCGYAVCIDCYKSRVTDGVVNGHKKNYDEYGWHLCNDRVKHDINHFHLALFITPSVFDSVNDFLHNVRNNLQIMGTCDCGKLETKMDMNAVRIPSNELKQMFRDIPQQWYCNDRFLVLTDPKCLDNIRIFQVHWLQGDPVMIQNVHLSLTAELWSPDSFNKNFGKQSSSLVNCMTGKIVPKRPMRDFWDGFEDIGQRILDQETGEEMLLKLKDWPPNAEFRDMLPLWFDNLMESLPLREYTRYDGIRNLSSRLPNFFVRPDLGPKMYCAYGSVMHPDKGTTNLHLDMSDAINVMLYVGIAKENDKPLEEHMKEANNSLLKGGCDEQMVNRVNECGRKVGALWHIFQAQDANKIRELLTKVAKERNLKKELNNDPIHDQSWYLDEILRQRLYDEYGVKGLAIAQCLGDAILVPAGAPHQVQNLHSCIKVAGEFVSPENLKHCVGLTHEFRKLSKRHNNHEDKLQIKNIIYHSAKDSMTSLLCVPPILPKPPLLSAPPVPQDLNSGDSMPTLKAESPIPLSPTLPLSHYVDSNAFESMDIKSDETSDLNTTPASDLNVQYLV